MTKKELLKLIKDLPDDVEILIESKREYREPVLSQEEIITEVWTEYDRNLDEMVEHSRDVYFFGQDDDNFKNKRKIISL